jgi:hypothetical protein
MAAAVVARLPPMGAGVIDWFREFSDATHGLVAARDSALESVFVAARLRLP